MSKKTKEIKTFDKENYKLTWIEVPKPKVRRSVVFKILQMPENEAIKYMQNRVISDKAWKNYWEQKELMF